MTRDEEDAIKICEVGDKFYKIVKNTDLTIITIVDIKFHRLGHYSYVDDKKTTYFTHSLKKCCFKTKEEALKEIKRRNIVAHKRQLLKEYEKKLNEELGIENHIIVK